MDIERIRLAEEEQVESQKSDKKLSSSKVIYKRWDYYYYNKSQSQSQQQKRAMMHTGVSTSKVLILVGAGLTGSVVLRSGRLSDVILQLQELMKGVNKAETSSSGKYDTALLAAQVQRLAQEIRELTLSRPVTILNGDSATAGNLASYLVPAAAVGAMGYCYMWWKGWSFSDVMFVTKQNMANAVANVSKQLEQVTTVLDSTKRHLSQRLENLVGKLDEEMETTKLIANEVIKVKSDLFQIGFDVGVIQKIVSGLEGKIELIESKQDITNSGLWYLCQFAGVIKDGVNHNHTQLWAAGSQFRSSRSLHLRSISQSADNY